MKLGHNRISSDIPVLDAEEVVDRINLEWS